MGGRPGVESEVDQRVLPYGESVGTGLSAVRKQRHAIRAAARRHRADRVSVFGSAARGDDQPGSDIDFLVEFGPDASLVDLIELQDELERLLGRPVDVVSAGGLKPRDAAIRRDAVPV